MATNEYKNKGGRPKLAATEKKKYALPPVHLDTKNYFWVKAQARRAGLSMTEYQRQKILTGKIVERLSPEQMEIFRDAEMYHKNVMHVNNLIKKILYDGKDN